PSNEDSTETLPQALISLQIELLRAKRDNRTLRQKFKDLIINIKLKKPILEMQKREYNLLITKNKELSAQLTKCETE
ncbi:hypothetical protein L0F63_000239, partial [Massospora cicadina]